MWDWRGQSLLIGSVVGLLTAYACGGSTGGGDDGGGVGGSIGASGGSGGVSASSHGASDSGGGNDGGNDSSGSDSNGNGAASSSGGGGSDDASSSSDAGLSGAGGGGGATEETSSDGSGGQGGVTCVGDPPAEDTCEYPESRGGGGDPAACGVTPGAWYALDGSAPTIWPEREMSRSPGGSVPTVTAKVGAHQVAFDTDSRPFVLWQEQIFGARRRLRHWNGSQWIDHGAHDLDDPRDIFDLVIDSAGRPVVVERGFDRVLVSRYEGSEWVALAEWFVPYPTEHLVDIAVGANDRPVVLYKDEDLRLKRWTGTTWEGLAGSDLPGGIENTQDGVQSIALALRPNGDPVIAWLDSGAVMLQQWNGSSWEELDGSATGDGVGTSAGAGVALGVDAEDRVVVSWSGHSRVWDGDSWSAIEDVGGDRPRLAGNAAGELYLLTDTETARERQLYHWEADAWEPLPGLTAEYKEAIDLAVAPDGHLGAAFGHHQVLYRDYAADAWTELGRSTISDADWIVREGEFHAGPALVAETCAVTLWNGTSWDVIPPPTQAQDCAYGRNSAGVIHLAFWTHDSDEFDTSAQILYLRVARLTAEGWEFLGDLDQLIDSDYQRAETKLEFDAEGRPVLAWLTGDDAGILRLARWDGSEWMNWGDNTVVPSATEEAKGLQLAMSNDDRPVLSVIYLTATHETRQVIEWTGGSWETSDAVSRSRTGRLLHPYRLVVDDTGVPVLAAPTDAGPRLVRQSPSGWELVAPTEDVLQHLPRAVRVDAWSEAGDGEVRLRYFADCAWQGLSASDRGNGVSNTQMHSGITSVSATESEICVSWTEATEEFMDKKVLVRCHQW